MQASEAAPPRLPRVFSCSAAHPPADAGGPASIPALFPTPRTPGNRQECPPPHSEQMHVSCQGTSGLKGERANPHFPFAFLPKCSLGRSHTRGVQLALMVTREAGTQENQRICCPSNFRTEVFVQFEEMKLPGNRGNQASWPFPASYSVKCASLAYLAGALVLQEVEAGGLL